MQDVHGNELADVLKLAGYESRYSGRLVFDAIYNICQSAIYRSRMSTGKCLGCNRDQTEMAEMESRLSRSRRAFIEINKIFGAKDSDHTMEVVLHIKEEMDRLEDELVALGEQIT